MPIQELLPSRPFNPVWSRRDAVILQNIGDRISSDRMTEIAGGRPKSADNPILGSPPPYE